MTATISGLTMYVKHIDASFALLVDDNEKEYIILMRDLKGLFPFNLKRIKSKSKKQYYDEKI